PDRPCVGLLPPGHGLRPGTRHLPRQGARLRLCPDCRGCWRAGRHAPARSVGERDYAGRDCPGAEPARRAPAGTRGGPMSRRRCACAWGLCVGSSTLAAETLTLSHGLSMQLGHGPQDSALGANQEPFYGLRYEPVLAWHWPDRRWPRWQGVMRTWFNYTSSQTSLPFQEQQRREIEHGNAELREFYLRRQLLGDDPRFALTLGRQRYADPYGLWWDDSLESVRLDYRATFSSGFLAVGERFAYYNSDGNTLEPGDQDIRYAMGEFAWRWHRHHWAGVRGLFEDDHSDRSFDDATDFTGWRAGFFAHGTLPGVARSSDYRLETLAL